MEYCRLSSACPAGSFQGNGRVGQSPGNAAPLPAGCLCCSSGSASINSRGLVSHWVARCVWWHCVCHGGTERVTVSLCVRDGVIVSLCVCVTLWHCHGGTVCVTVALFLCHCVWHGGTMYDTVRVSRCVCDTVSRCVCHGVTVCVTQCHCVCDTVLQCVPAEDGQRCRCPVLSPRGWQLSAGTGSFPRGWRAQGASPGLFVLLRAGTGRD